MRQGFCALIVAIFLAAVPTRPAHAIPHGKAAPEIAGSSWINSAPLTLSQLRGKVVLVEFWTFG